MLAVRDQSPALAGRRPSILSAPGTYRGGMRRLPAPPRLGRRITVHGTVQGVGFRPFVYRLAVELGLEGTVRNADGLVVIDAAGTQDAVGEFVRRIDADAPPLARVDSVAVSELPA